MAQCHPPAPAARSGSFAAGGPGRTLETHARQGGTMPAPQPLVAVFGSSTARPGASAWRLAHDLGRELARAGAAVMSGGYSGVMEAVSQGAHEAGGHVVGVTVELFEARGPVNPWVRERVHTGDLYQRLRYLVERPAAFVVLPGSIGTLTELFLVWTLVSVRGRERAPIVLLGETWPGLLEALRHPEAVPRALFEHIEHASDPADAVRRALAATGRDGAAASSGDRGEMR